NHVAGANAKPGGQGKVGPARTPSTGGYQEDLVSVRAEPGGQVQAQPARTPSTGSYQEDLVSVCAEPSGQGKAYSSHAPNICATDDAATTADSEPIDGAGCAAGIRGRVFHGFRLRLSDRSGRILPVDYGVPVLCAERS